MPARTSSSSPTGWAAMPVATSPAPSPSARWSPWTARATAATTHRAPEPEHRRRERRDPVAGRPQPGAPGHGHHGHRPPPRRQQGGTGAHRRLPRLPAPRGLVPPDHARPLLRAVARRRGPHHRGRGRQPPAALAGDPRAHGQRRRRAGPHGPGSAPGDRFLLCSDGLSGFVARDTIEEVLSAGKPVGPTADRLVELALRAGAPTTSPWSSPTSSTSTPAPRPLPHPRSSAPPRSGAGVARPDPCRSPRREGCRALTRGHRRRRGHPRGGEPRSGRARLRRGAVALLVLLVLGGGAYAAYDWVQRQFYVGVHDGSVAIYRGVSQDLGPISLSRSRRSLDLHGRPAGLLPQPGREHRLHRHPRRRAGARRQPAGRGGPLRLPEGGWRHLRHERHAHDPDHQPHDGRDDQHGQPERPRDHAATQGDHRAMTTVSSLPRSRAATSSWRCCSSPSASWCSPTSMSASRPRAASAGASSRTARVCW